jgi:ribosome biogenesis ATPase
MGPRPSLQNNLDREVLQAVRRYQDEKPENSSLKVHLLYQYIQQSNSSLRRKQKHLIEDSIERVISVLRQDEKDGDESADQSGGATRAASPNFMNRLVVNSWNTTANTSSSLTADSGNAGKKRDSASNTNGEPRKKKRKQEPTGSTIPSKYNLENIGGLDHVAEQLEELLVLPLLEPETYIENKIEIPRGILLHGPPGCGKTLISRAFAAELAVPFIEILGPSVVSGMSGESEQKIREHFEEAKRLAPSILFIDEIDVLAPKRETSQSQMEKRIVAQLLISMDSLEMETNDGKPVIVLAATNRPDSLDPALRRGGRFDTEINLTVPNEKMRESILRTQMREMNVLGDVDFSRLAKMTAGFVGSDLHDLISKAASWTMEKYRQALQEQAMEDDDNNAMDIDDKSRRANPTSETVRRTRLLIRRLRQKDKPKPEGFETMQLRMEAFLTVLPKIQPSSKREGFATVPDTTWEDIGALEEAREKLIKDIVRPIENPEVYERMHVATPAGVLLWGPPGCGKTLLAKAVANESKANFISIKGPELLNKVSKFCAYIQKFSVILTLCTVCRRIRTSCATSFHASSLLNSVYFIFRRTRRLGTTP